MLRLGGDFSTFIRDGICGGRECAGACIEWVISRCMLRNALAVDEEVGHFVVREDTSIKWDAGGLGKAGSECRGGSIRVQVERESISNVEFIFCLSRFVMKWLR